MKKTVSYVLIFSLLLLCFTFTSSATREDAVTVTAKSAVLMDVATGQVLYSKNENERKFPASVVKIMPLLLVMEAIDSGKISLSDVVTASGNAASKGGSQIWLKEGEQMTVDELLRATAIASANDACTALGEYIAGSEEAFVSMMNSRAKELGMNNTNFVNCSGLDDDTDELLTTAYDIALMSRELLSHERIRSYTTVWMDSLRGGETELVNTNRLVRFYNGTTGLKTGTTEKAGYCLSASAERDNLHLIAVVLDAESSDDRFEDAKKMLNWGFANFVSFTPEIDTSLITDVRVLKGIEAYITPKISSLRAITVNSAVKNELRTEINLATDVEAPVEKNQVLGTVTLKNGEETVATYSLVSETAVGKINMRIMMERFIKSLAKG